MSKLYVGNLPSDCNESALRQLFQEHSLACTTILVKRGGYAFVDCADQSTADRAIDKLNGLYVIETELRHAISTGMNWYHPSQLRHHLKI
ncbi:Insulin-like growth factor 2 mRNA-binding protein 3-A [Acromyrmex echinatior]|uniref:Insulin-like growth factor 2 mRNA-binding protein 3-A n=1 Tax=Acromyrmex echinatior TaxID=103372 RepID=F4WK53_ACREC|nr:Insulin-like growth factor 2 mRNA-binding protein 3-A [Acromyrmex echinatior]